MNDDQTTPRRGFAFGFGLSGLLSAALAYYAFDAHLFDGPAWRSALLAAAIGGGSAALLLGAEKLLHGVARVGRRGRAPKIRGEWGCPQCGAGYVPEAVECSDCHVPLVSAKVEGR